MTNKISKYKYGDKVCIATGVIDPDFSINIEGWSGEIDKIELLENGSWMYRIVWDEITLEIAGGEYISKCEEENLDFENIYLLEKELEHIKNNNGHNKLGVFVA